MGYPGTRLLSVVVHEVQLLGAVDGHVLRLLGTVVVHGFRT